MEKNLFIDQLENNTQDVVQLAKSFTSSQLAYKEAGKWNILEILEHIYLTDKIVMMVISKPSESIHTSEELFGTGKLKAMLVTARDTKISAPEPLHPKGIFTDISTLEKAFLQQRDSLKSALLTEDLIIENRTHKHPILGEMTISDWLYFIIHHTERHMEQIKDTANVSLVKQL